MTNLSAKTNLNSEFMLINNTIKVVVSSWQNVKRYTVKLCTETFTYLA